jgi:transcriptional regulator
MPKPKVNQAKKRRAAIAAIEAKIKLYQATVKRLDKKANALYAAADDADIESGHVQMKISDLEYELDDNWNE